MLIASPALAETTGWISGGEWRAKSRELDKSGFMPTKFECRDSERPGLDLAAGEVRVGYTKNPKNIAWYWWGTSNMTETNAEMKSKGYHLVSVGSFVRKKSGLKLYCALYYKS